MTLWDRTTALALVGHDEQLLCEVVQSYLIVQTGYLQRIERSLQQPLEERRESAHALRSAALSISATGLAELLADFEDAAAEHVAFDYEKAFLRISRAASLLRGELARFTNAA